MRASATTMSSSPLSSHLNRRCGNAGTVRRVKSVTMRRLDQQHHLIQRNRSSVTTSSSSSPSSADETDGDDENDFVVRTAIRALLPSFLAMRRGSRFAHQEFVRRCAECARSETRKATVSDARIEAALMGLSSVIRMGTSEQDAFASAFAMVTLTLFWMDAEKVKPSDESAWTVADAAASDPLTDDPEAKGMLKYIAATHRAADEGFTLKRMELERRFSMSDDDGANGKRRPTPGEAIMRMNCKLTLLTREMVERERGIAQVKGELAALSEREVISTDGDGRDQEGGDATGDDDATDDVASSLESYEEEPTAQVALSWCIKERTAARDVASDMLVAFFSVLTGHPVGYRAFVDAARRGYELGISASEITSALEPPEFDVEGTRRGMFGRSADAPKLFSGFVTTAYVALEAEGVPLPSAANGDEELFAYACAPRAPDEREEDDDEDAPPRELTDDAKRRATRGLRLAVDSWLEMDRETLTDEVSASLSEDEGDEDVAKPFASASSAASSSSSESLPPFPTDSSFAVVRDEAFGATSITLATLRHQRNIVAFIRNSFAKP